MPSSSLLSLLWLLPQQLPVISMLSETCVLQMLIHALTHAVFVNGFVYKDPMLLKAEDFFLSDLDKPRNTMNKVGSNVMLVNVNRIPGLDTLSIFIAQVNGDSNAVGRFTLITDKIFPTT
ncbi:hypothetical protein C4D60_Mb06t24330 [Musa balbisiana]|uniref:Dirigent protein n=1 Tax=Musa balbisiana TaxID=52838 RepID=A0A4S8IQA7_MUSBA|nr:hypothetical protein C4D60_Mb06t24330 [Musa balbisiana]